MTTWHKATLPPVSSKVAGVCENGGQVHGQLVVAGRRSGQMVSAAPRCPGSGGRRVVWGVYNLAPCILARRPKRHHVGPRRPARPCQGATSVFLKVTSLTVVGVVSRKTSLALKNLLTLSGPCSLCYQLEYPKAIIGSLHGYR